MAAHHLLFTAGEAGDWRSKLTPEQVDKMNTYVRETFKGTELETRYSCQS